MTNEAREALPTIEEIDCQLVEINAILHPNWIQKEHREIIAKRLHHWLENRKRPLPKLTLITDEEIGDALETVDFDKECSYKSSKGTIFSTLDVLPILRAQLDHNLRE